MIDYNLFFAGKIMGDILDPKEDSLLHEDRKDAEEAKREEFVTSGVKQDWEDRDAILDALSDFDGLENIYGCLSGFSKDELISLLNDPTELGRVVKQQIHKALIEREEWIYDNEIK